MTETIDGSPATVENDVVAGFAAGFASKLVEHPLDTIKVRLQTVPELHGQSPLRCYRRVLAKEGAATFLRGLPGPMFGAVVENMALFTVYNLAGRRFFPQVRVEQDGIQDLHPLQAAVCGTLATSCVAPVITPIEYVKIQMQRKGTNFRSSWNVVSHYCEKGPVGASKLFTGFQSTFLREFCGGFGFFLSYSVMRLMLKLPDGSVNSSAWASCATGAVSGFSFWLSMYPIDLMKSRIQMGYMQPGLRPLLTSLAETSQREGVRGLYSGFSATIPRAMLSAAVIVGVYEQTKLILDSTHHGLFPGHA